MKKYILIFGVITLFNLLLQPIFATESVPIFKHRGYAINGYDPVAYFKEQQAVIGKKDLQYQWQNVTWLFSSNENKELFISDPERFAPQFGGYCAYGIAGNYFAKTDPDAWTILDNKLYLNYNRSIRDRWLRNTGGYVKQAQQNWLTLKNTR